MESDVPSLPYTFTGFFRSSAPLQELREQSKTDHSCQIQSQNEIGQVISARIPERLHLGAAFSPVIAPGFHGSGQVIGPPDGGDEEGNDDGNHALHAADQVR